MNDKEDQDKKPAGETPAAFHISAPDPLPEGDVQWKIKTNRVPRPAPQKADTTQAKSEEPISSETISIKRSDLKEESKPRIDIDRRKLKIVCYHCGQKLDLTDMEPFSEVECPACNVKIIVPKWFENYLLEEPGGEGGMATVFRALDLTLDREVAIKILNPSFASETDRSQLFLHEARTAATINHYAVIPVYTCGISDEKPFIVMQYMDGGALDSKLEKANGRLPVGQVVKWFKDIADGLDNARRHGIIHHDVKPANILLDKDGNAKIGDFGIAQILHDWRSENITKITKTWASPNYVSPEKVMTGQEDHFGDIYSLGVSMFQMLTGQLPFDDPDMRTLIRMRLEKDPPNPKEIRMEIPLKISQLIISMMNRSPDKRPTYREIVNEIDKHLKLNESVKKTPEKADAKPKKPAIRRKKTGGGMPRFSNRFKKEKWSPLNLVVHATISIFMIGGAIFLWKGGYLEEIFGRRGALAKTMPQDMLPEATAQFRSGNPAKASEIAREAAESAGADKKLLKQAIVQAAVGIYLQNLPDAKIECLSFAEKLSNYGVDEDDPAMLLIRFMSNGETYTSSLKEAFPGDDYYRALASYCLYVKSIYDGGKDLERVSFSRRCLAAGEKVPLEFWGNAWFDRVHIWKEWMEFGRGDVASLEPLIAANKYELTSQGAKKPDLKTAEKPETVAMIPPKQEKSELDTKPSDEKTVADVDLSLLTAKWLEDDRASFASGRPRPSDYNFTASQMDGYLAGVQESRRENERTRLNQVSGMKHYLCQLLSRSAYNKPVKTINGKTFTGQMMANPNYISIKTGKGFQRLDWNQLPPAEMTRIISHFAEARMKVSGAAGTSAETRRKEAAQDYLRLAILCDWYGDYPSAVGYARKSISVYPDSEKSVKKFMMK